MCTSEDSDLHLMVFCNVYRMSLMKAVVTTICLIAAKVQVSAAINGTAAVTVELVSFDPTTEVSGLPNVSVPENGTNLTLLCAQLSGGITSERNVTVRLSTGTGTAQGMNSSVTLTSTNQRQCINITVVDDSICEADEIIPVLLTTNEDPSEVMLNPSFAMVTIIDDDVANIAIQMMTNSITVPEQDRAVEVCAELTGVTDMLECAVTNNATLTGSTKAEEGEDFASNGSLTFNFQMGAATQFQACIDIWIMNDMDFEGDHSFEVTLGPNTPALRGGTGGFGSPTSTTITIQDHEDAQVSLQLIANVTEGSTFNVSIELETSGTLNCDLVVTLLAIPGTATEEDYILPLNNCSQFTVIFGVGSDDERSASSEGSGCGNVQTAMISTVGDDVVEGDRYFTVSINSTSPPAMLGTSSSMIVTILDDDFVTVGFMRRELAVSENLTEASVEVCANLSETLTITRTVSANVSVQPGKGEAEVNSDFVFSPRLLEFCLANFTMACDNITIAITDDDIPEDTEYFCAVLSTNDTAVNLSVNMINITILDDDNATNNIQRIGMIVVDTENAEEVVNSLTINVAVARGADQSVINFDVITRVIEDISQIAETRNISLQPLINITTNVVGIIDNVTQWPDNARNVNASRIIDAFEDTVTVILQDTAFNTTLVVENNNVALRAERVSQEDLQRDGRTFGAGASDDGPVSQRVENGTMSALPEDQDASIALPASLFRELGNIAEVGIGFTFYEMAALFPLPEGSPSNITIGSSVIGALVAGQNFTNLSDPVNIFLRLTQTDNFSNPRCVSWNFTAAGGRGNWTTDGCELSEANGTIVTCRCNHLTNFGCLVDICTRIGGCQELPPSIQLALDIISTVGVSLSLFGLAVTVFTLFVFKKFRQRDISKFHIQLCISLFCMLIVFVSGIDETSVYEGCVAVSVLIHYFTLVIWMWMGALAVYMYQKLVVVFVHTTTRYIITVSIVCWLVPIVPVVIPLAIDTDFMVTFSPNTTVNDTIRFCFIGDPGVLFGAYLGPIFAILLFNSVIFIIVVTVLIKQTRKKMGSNNRTNRQKVIRIMISIIGLMALFGLTWVFAAFTVSVVSTAFQLLFAIFNSLQGFFIFLFFCVFGREGRELWLKVLCCGRKVPGIISSTQPNVKRQRQTTYQRPSQQSTISSRLRSDPPTSTRNTAHLSSSSDAIQSSVFNDSEVSQEMSTVEVNPMAPQLGTVEEESRLDEPQSALQSSTFSEMSTVRANPTALQLESSEEEGPTEAGRITVEEHDKTNSPHAAKVPDHNTVYLPVLVRRSSTVRHHVEVAELSFSGNEDDSDSEVFANPNSENTNI